MIKTPNRQRQAINSAADLAPAGSGGAARLGERAEAQAAAAQDGIYQAAQGAGETETQSGAEHSAEAERTDRQNRAEQAAAQNGAGQSTEAERTEAQSSEEQQTSAARGAFFGRRKGRPLRPRQERLYGEILPLLAVDLSRPAPQDLASLFAAPPGFARKVENVRLEIGFGGGEHLLHEAARCPGTGFIGAEPFINGMAKMLAALEAEPQKAANIRLYNDDALRLLDWLPAESLTGIDIFYPDPWPKKKHWKRRFVSAENLSRFARLLRRGGLLRFASDIDSYVNQVLSLMRGRADFDWTAQSAKDWQTPYEGWPSTRYEAKAKREGRKTAYLTFIRL